MWFESTGISGGGPDDVTRPIELAVDRAFRSSSKQRRPRAGDEALLPPSAPLETHAAIK
jgi:hypothetical protein